MLQLSRIFLMVCMFIPLLCLAIIYQVCRWLGNFADLLDGKSDWYMDRLDEIAYDPKSSKLFWCLVSFTLTMFVLYIRSLI